MTGDCVIALTTVPADHDGAALARTLVDEGLAACVNLLPEMVSVYRWKEAIQQDRERQIVIKTTQARVAALWERIRALHPYDVPEFVVLPIVDGSDAYLRWIAEAAAGPPP